MKPRVGWLFVLAVKLSGATAPVNMIDVPYARVGEQKLMLDLYRPAGEAR